MNNRLLLPLALVFLLCTCARAQESQPPPNRRAQTEQRSPRLERVRAAKEAFITEQLALTKTEADAFFPLYREYEQRLRDVPSRHRIRGSNSDLTEEQARLRIRERNQGLLDYVNVRIAAEEAYLTVLPATKVLRLKSVERDFLRQLRDRRREKRDPPRHR